MARVVRLKDILLNPLKYGANESGVEFDENLPRYIRITDITEEGLLKDDNKLSLDINEYLLEDDDVLLARSGATVGKSFLYKKKYGRATYAGYLIKASFHRKYCLAKYFYYYTLSNYYDEWKNKNIIQATIQNLSAEKYNYLQFSLPDLPTQHRIADYLDKQTEMIDKKISLLAQKIEKYKLLKKTIINNAVWGKGKDWEWVRVKDVFDSQKGLSITKEDLLEEGIPVISYGQIHDKNNNGVSIEPFLIRYVSPHFLDSNSSSLVNEGDFIFADTSEDLEGTGNCVYVDKQMTLFAGYHTIILRAKRKANYKFWAYYFQTEKWRENIRRGVGGTRSYSITQKILVGLKLPKVDADIQREVVDYLESKTSKIDAIVYNLQKQIEKYKMLKRAVIDKAVGTN